MGRRIDQAKLLAKIAALTGAQTEDLEKAAEKSKQTNLQTYEEQIYEAQAVVNFYRARVEPRPPVKKAGEKELDFIARKIEYDKAYNEWRIRICKGCDLPFAYAYHYDGVAFCSLDCVDSDLRKIGLQVTRGRDLKKRWGTYHPAVVSSSAFQALQSLPEFDDEIVGVQV